MADIVVIGAGLSGTLMAYELLAQVRGEDRVTVISQGAVYHFVPSNPWVAVGWRKRADIEIDLADVMKRKGIRLLTQGAKRVHPADNRVELTDGTSLNYDYLVVATGPELAFDEIPGLGPLGHTQSVCHVDHAAHAKAAFDKLAENPGPVVIGAVQGASCFGPAYEFLFILETELRRRKLRDRVPMTFVTSESISAISVSTGSATRRACSRARCAKNTSSGSPMPGSTACSRDACRSRSCRATARCIRPTSCRSPMR